MFRPGKMTNGADEGNEIWTRYGRDFTVNPMAVSEKFNIFLYVYLVIFISKLHRYLYTVYIRADE